MADSHKATSGNQKGLRRWQKLARKCQKLPLLAKKLEQAESRVAERAEKLKEMRRQARKLAVAMPVILEIQTDRDPAVMAELPRVWAIRPGSDAGLRRRWKWLRQVWQTANAQQAALVPPEPPLVWLGWDCARSDTLFRSLPAAKKALHRARTAAARARERLRSAVRVLQEHLAGLKAPGKAGPPPAE